jgi:hypothetical protein
MTPGLRGIQAESSPGVLGVDRDLDDAHGRRQPEVVSRLVIIETHDETHDVVAARLDAGTSPPVLPRTPFRDESNEVTRARRVAGFHWNRERG